MGNYSSTADKNTSIKKVHKVGALHILVIDRTIIDRLGIHEDTYFRQSLGPSGEIILKIEKKTPEDR